LLSGLDDRGQIVRNLLAVSPPSVCDIFRSGASGTLQYCDMEEKGGGRTTPEDAALRWQRNVEKISQN
jgi:hypothetical protein